MDQTRPTKKQRELLTFIENFIAGHGYAPSYREIMRGLGYKSVASVGTHIDNLISRGHLKKKDNSARSLEVVGSAKQDSFKTNTIKPSEEKWLVQLIELKFSSLEGDPAISQALVDELYVLVGALQVLGFESASSAFRPRLAALKKRVS